MTNLNLHGRACWPIDEARVPWGSLGGPWGSLGLTGASFGGSEAPLGVAVSPTDHFVSDANGSMMFGDLNWGSDCYL